MAADPNRPERIHDGAAFICTGNTCRSPMAHCYYASLVAAGTVRGTAVYGSCGTQAGDAPAAAHAQTIMTRLGLSLAEHRSKPVDKDFLSTVPVIFCLADSHVTRLKSLDLGQEINDKIQKLRLDGMDIADPYGGTLEQYETAWGEIKEAIDARVAIPPASLT
eukprot:gene19048-6375_t